MGIEIERKFLLANDAWRAAVSYASPMSQGYLIDADAVQAQRGTRCSMRIRISGAQAWLNIKSATLGIARQEYEYTIPLQDAQRMLADFCDGRVEKIRHFVPYAGMTYEVDEFVGENAGLIVAELELESEDQAFERPAWLGREVSTELRYFNLHLLRYPFAQWSAADRRGETSVALSKAMHPNAAQPPDHEKC